MQASIRRRLLGERRALALLVLGFYTTLFLLVALAQGGDWARCFGALALTYGLTFFGVAAEYFWGRWFAMGIATSGMTMALLGLLTSGWNAGLAIWGVLHAVIYLPLLGLDMAQLYDGQAGWRDRYQLDESAVERIRRSVQGAAAALPTLILYALAPRQGAALLTAAVVFLAVAGTWGLLRMRFWGVLLLGASGVGAALHLVLAPLSVARTLCPHLEHFPSASIFGLGPIAALSPLVLGVVASSALVVASAPFVLPAYRRLRR